MSQFRRSVRLNPDARSWPTSNTTDHSQVTEFHKQLPDYHPTPLMNVPELAKELGLGAVYIKNESSRFNLPSFKILGASWGAYKALVQTFDLPLGADIAQVKEAASKDPKCLFAATDGNHGRAVARIGALFGLPVEIHVPVGIASSTIELIRDEGANVVESSSNYDATILEAQRASQKASGILVQDVAFDNYLEIPRNIVDGYCTMMHEIDDQLGSVHADLVVAPVGVGSFAQAVVSHFRAKDQPSAILTVEPDTAACFWKSFGQGTDLRQVTTYPTIMAGLECGTVSTIAWPILRSGVDASLTISDHEAHVASLDLHNLGISAGPCGAASLAALRRLSDDCKSRLGLTKDSTVVLFCTEGARNYEAPLDVSTDDVVALTQRLVSINSVNPSMGSIPGPGETMVARYIAAWLEHRDIETHWIETTKGRPSVVGVVRGSGSGKSLMLNGHIDIVAVAGYDGDPFSGKIEQGRLYGRGAADMKAGVAAAMITLARSKCLSLRGDVIFAGVADEEAESIGTEQLLEAGWRADGAVVSEPSQLYIVNAHKGFVWFEVDIYGTAAHGSRPDLGHDAIAKAGYFLVEIDQLAQRLQRGLADDPLVDLPSVHASIIKGGEEASSYPALCTVTLERRTVPGETTETTKQELLDILEKLQQQIPDFKYELRITFTRSPFQLEIDHPFASLVVDCVGQSLGREPDVRKDAAWTDCALLADAGIPPIMWGPRGEGIHSKQEWVDVESVKQVAKTLTMIAGKFCA